MSLSRFRHAGAGQYGRQNGQDHDRDHDDRGHLAERGGPPVMHSPPPQCLFRLCGADDRCRACLGFTHGQSHRRIVSSRNTTYIVYKVSHSCRVSCACNIDIIRLCGAVDAVSDRFGGGHDRGCGSGPCRGIRRPRASCSCDTGRCRPGRAAGPGRRTPGRS